VTPERPLVWYAAYGSNLDGTRLARYLAEARDTTAPRRDGGRTVDHRLLFGAHSEQWGGGVAFLDPTAGSGEARVRLWLLGLDQLADVYAQENRHPVGSVSLDPDRLDEALPEGRYRRLLSLAEHDGTPVITFTAPEPPEPAAPSRAYLAHLVTGLRMSHRLDDDGVVAYLMAVPGMAPAWSADSLAAMLAGRLGANAAG
jgi:hypothetical protein